MQYIQQMPGRPGPFSDNLVRVGIEVYKLEKQNLVAQDTDYITIGPAKGYFEFLVVETLLENLNHTWDEFGNVAAGVGELARKTIEALGAVGGTNLNKTIKFDAPKIWSGSERRKLNLSITLVDHDNPGLIQNVVTELKRLGSAKIGQTKGEVQFPNIFRLYTLPHEFINYEYCLLEAMQVTHSEFRSDGHPAKIDMTLVFEDLQPLYETLFGYTAKVTVGVERGESPPNVVQNLINQYQG